MNNPLPQPKKTPGKRGEQLRQRLTQMEHDIEAHIPPGVSAKAHEYGKAVHVAETAWFEKIGRAVVWIQGLTGAGFSTNEQAFFAKRLAFLISGEVPILESLQLLREQTRSHRTARVLDVIVRDVSAGKALYESLQKFPDTFDDFAINIIRVGETSGILSQNLNYLAEELKKKQALRRKVIGALVYPLVVTVATVAITVFLTVYLFPKIMPVFMSLNMKLPLSTKIVIALSIFLRKWGLEVLGGVVVFVIVFNVLRRRVRRFRWLFEYSMLKLPIVGLMIEYYNLANFSRTLGLLLKSGVTLTTSLSIAADTSTNLVYKEQFAAMKEAINRGEGLAGYLRSHPKLFSDILPQMVSVGERSGNLFSSLLYLSDFYENEVDDFSKNLSSLVEPVLMVGMGLLVGFIAISIITPIYGITQNLHP